MLSLCKCVCHQAQNLLGKKQSLTGDPVGLATWQHFYLIVCLHERLNEWVNSHCCHVLFVIDPLREKRKIQFCLCNSSANNNSTWKHWKRKHCNIARFHLNILINHYFIVNNHVRFTDRHRTTHTGNRRYFITVTPQLCFWYFQKWHNTSAIMLENINYNIINNKKK